MPTQNDLVNMMHEIAGREGRTDGVSVAYGQFLSEHKAYSAASKTDLGRHAELIVLEDEHISSDDDDVEEVHAGAQERNQKHRNPFTQETEMMDDEKSVKSDEQEEPSDFDTEGDDVDRRAQDLASATTKNQTGSRKRATTNDTSPLASKRSRSDEVKSAIEQLQRNSPKKSPRKSEKGRKIGGRAH